MEHNTSKLGARYTRNRRPVELVYAKKFRNRSTATKAELRIKKLSRAEKISLIYKPDKSNVSSTLISEIKS